MGLSVQRFEDLPLSPSPCRRTNIAVSCHVTKEVSLCTRVFLFIIKSHANYWPAMCSTAFLVFPAVSHAWRSFSKRCCLHVELFQNGN